ncbi:MAG: hypothetical protein Q9202_002492 [Teloschistes flavicans]
MENSYESSTWCPREDAIALTDVRDLDLASQVTLSAQSNVEWLTGVLLHGDIANSHKPTIRDYLRYAENAVNPGLDTDLRDILERLDDRSATVRRWLEDHPAKPIPNMIKRHASRILCKDIEFTTLYLQHLLLLRYQHSGNGSERIHPQRLRWDRLKPLSMYLRWKRTQDHQIAVALAHYAGLHPVELDREYAGRVSRLLRTISVDSEYVESRLIDLVNIWHWVSAYNMMANTGRWDELASQFLDDRQFLDDIYPGRCVYASSENAIPRHNDKAQVYIGMMIMHEHFFTELHGPAQYKLSKHAAKMRQRYEREQKRLRQDQREERERQGQMIRETPEGHMEEGSDFKSRPIAKIRTWFKESVSVAFKRRGPSEHKLSCGLSREREVSASPQGIEMGPRQRFLLD